MATTSLKTRTLGSINLQSGIGSPDHNAGIGSLYVDEDSGIFYKRFSVSGNTNWGQIRAISYSAIAMSAETSQALSSVGTWVSISGSSFNWSGDSINGLTREEGKFTVNSGSTGLYTIDGHFAFAFSIDTENIEIGVSINQGVPDNGAYYGGSLYTDFLTPNNSVGFNILKRLEPSDTVELAVRTTTASTTIIIKTANLALNRIEEG